MEIPGLVALQPHNHVGQAPLLLSLPDTASQADSIHGSGDPVVVTGVHHSTSSSYFSGLIVSSSARAPVLPTKGPLATPITAAGYNKHVPAPNQTPSLSIFYSVPQWTKRKVQFSLIILSSIIALLLPDYPNSPGLVGAAEKAKLANSNPRLYWPACRWLNICETKSDQTTPESNRPSAHEDDVDCDATCVRRANNAESEAQLEHNETQIPQYVLQYAPFVRLFSRELYWPCNIAEHLLHVTPYLNYTPIKAAWDHSTLRDLDRLNLIQRGKFVFLTSNDNVESGPDWLGGEENIPSPFLPEEPDQGTKYDDRLKYWRGRFGHPGNQLPASDGNSPQRRASSSAASGKAVAPRELLGGPEANPGLNPTGGSAGSDTGGKSDAPAVLIVVDKGAGIVDAFWFYFYSFNLGNKVVGIRFGNHVGDWEHTLVRFQHGKPKAIFLSEHSFGEAYNFAAMEKIGQRPVVYSAEGSHAMYATPGTHAYVLPWGLLQDRTDRGPLWDPALNFHAYTYDVAKDILKPSNLTPTAPTQWFYFSGHWGDKLYPISDNRQYTFAGQYHYVSGPLGPRFKNLGRKNICQGLDDQPCVIRDGLDYEIAPKRWVYTGEGEEMSEKDYKRFLEY